MELFPILPGNGKEIFINIYDLFIPNEWINNELHAIVIPDIPLSESNPVYEAYKEMFKEMFEKGYKVETDSSVVSDDAFFFSPCIDDHINKSKEEYKTKKTSKIKYYLESEGIVEPLSISFPVDSFPDILPQLPFVLKNEDNQGGDEKFILRTPEQVEILKRFYNETLTLEKNFSPWERWDCKSAFHEHIRIQKYIKTPTKYNTSLRVMTSSSGDILASSLKYSEPASYTKKKYYGFFDRYLSDPDSPYFIGNESIVSNTIAGGNSILLGKNNYSELEQSILVAHGIDPNNADVPQDVKNACIKVAINCRREVGSICGLDFIYDDEEKKWKYLEEHEYPMLYSYAEKYGFSYDSNADDFFTTDKLLDQRIRLHALSLTM